MDLKIDDLLEKVSQHSAEVANCLSWRSRYRGHLQQKDGVALLDLEYVSLSVPKVLTLLNK